MGDVLLVKISLRKNENHSCMLLYLCITYVLCRLFFGNEYQCSVGH